MEMEYLRENQILAMIPVDRTTIWRWEKKGDFPKRRKLGSNTVGWLKSEVQQWMKDRPQI